MTKTLFLFVFYGEYLTGGTPLTDGDRKSVLKKGFADIGWESPQILSSMAGAGSIYFGRVSQIRMDRWANGRTALIGDAAACVSPMAGEGTGLAMAESYVLAGELRLHEGDHVAVFAVYQRRLMPFLKSKQRMAAKFASSFAPRTAFGLEFHNLVTRLLRFPFVADFLFSRDVRDDIELPTTGFSPVDAARSGFPPESFRRL